MKESSEALGMFLSRRRALIDYAAGITKDRSRAEDVVQEAYLRIQSSLHEKGGEIHYPPAYLYRIVRNLSLDFSRSEVREQRRNESPPEWLIPGEADSPEQLYQRSDELKHLARALDSLPEKSRRALEMHRFGEYTLTDIANRLGVSTATAHRLVRDALVRLAQELPDAAQRRSGDD